MKVSRIWAALLGAIAAHAAIVPTTTTKRTSSPFVSSEGSEFVVNGTNFKYIGTNAYWLPTLQDDEISTTLAKMAATGIKVVRLWAFNDVDAVPSNGTYFQVIQDGKTSINEGPNGLQRLDKVIELAEQQGLYVLLSLTNNFFPNVAKTSTKRGESQSLPRNYLSNDYGGMDLYVREFGAKHHDDFFTEEKIISAFQNYTSHIVSRYADKPSVFSWEIANGPSCNSTLPSSGSCQTTTVTKWHATMASHIKSVDPNHLVSAGTSGGQCLQCTKLFPLSAPSPQPSPSVKRRNVKQLTKKQLLKDRSEARRNNRKRAIEEGTLAKDGVQIRGRWVSTAAKRQSSPEVGQQFDGSTGVDSQDIMNIPDVGFGSFQLFPDQNNYAADDTTSTSSSDSFANTVNTGVDWINNQAQLGGAVGKPTIITGFGLVTQGNAPNFVPFNSSSSTDASSNASSDGVSNDQQDSAYTTWVNTGVAQGVNGIMQYQWGQSNVQTPNDGYSSSSNDGVQTVLQNAAQGIAADN
ncbi:glycoside hydrolase family 5 protein [Coniophora puteana RWD-64-598 SS2]|uniref:mannan endo-1,4-beta-mannosidase n=1 Tax=Coniophora puteana (strain RWD-64-598) TaxID=741705 RepID=A0A5M3N2F0_CONPW|nr:glycoside hydrolase family 5 protein [Coniophora puteana RWD-64-598 SS2]EIW85194.1 glycoside hydrolase family 5 protein [Coniophora puteana RWD-64-598 SS2]